MRVTYSINARLAGGGIGHTAHNAVRAIHQRGWLRQLFVSSNNTHEFDDVDIHSMGYVGRAMKRIANFDATNRLYSFGDEIFDRWTCQRIADCDIFHGWANHVLASLPVAQKHGAITIVDRGGSHILQSESLLNEEYKLWGLQAHREIPRTVDRCLREYEETDFILVPSQYNYDSFISRGFDRKRLLHIPMGVDTGKFEPRWDLPEHPFRVLFVGQVSIRKGIGYLLEAWRQAQLTAAELIIAGEVKADAQKVVKPYLNDPSIRWLGFVGAPVNLYRNAHAFVLPSIDEGSALVTLEAMACGLACIVTYNSGALIRDDLDGFIVPLRNSELIAERLRYLHGHPDERMRIGRAARKTIEPMTWTTYGDSLLRAYEQCEATKK